MKTNTKVNFSTEYRFRLEFYVFQEDDTYIAYCPSLDISTSGDTFNDAVANFYERFQLHIEWCEEHGTLLKDLAEHGWKINNRRLRTPAAVTTRS